MRIEAYAQVQQLYGTKKPAQVRKQSPVSFADQVQISSLGKDIQTAKTAVAGAPDVREDKIREMREKLESGNYEVDIDDFADKLFSAYTRTL